MASTQVLFPWPSTDAPAEPSIEAAPLAIALAIRAVAPSIQEPLEAIGAFAQQIFDVLEVPSSCAVGSMVVCQDLLSRGACWRFSLATGTVVAIKMMSDARVCMYKLRQIDPTLNLRALMRTELNVYRNVEYKALFACLTRFRVALLVLLLEAPLLLRHVQAQRHHHFALVVSSRGESGSRLATMLRGRSGPPLAYVFECCDTASACSLIQSGRKLDLVLIESDGYFADFDDEDGVLPMDDESDAPDARIIAETLRRAECQGHLDETPAIVALLRTSKSPHMPRVRRGMSPTVDFMLTKPVLFQELRAVLAFCW
uniref:Uncharacterized protein n=1 Tax=Chrysotila carterae TaxID=13221 RepID=A0A7S4C5D7_CHRCT|mmetsp:Transcript_54982/g.119934  ORF Transcript_54982/g.119934 Transcript_54982/m.119934 type:complete len:314 (+) Transcript_54982:350-1291(+)